MQAKPDQLQFCEKGPDHNK